MSEPSAPVVVELHARRPALHVIGIMAAGLLLGGGHALLGRWQRGLAWAGAIAIIVLLTFVWPPIALATPLLTLLSLVDVAFLARRPGPLRSGWFAMVASISVIFLASVRVLALEAFKIPSSAMAPTLVVGDRIFVDKLTVRWDPPGRGDVVVFHFPMRPEVTFVKRLVAVAGDRVAIRDGALWIEGLTSKRTLLGPGQYDEQDEMTHHWSVGKGLRYLEEVGDRRRVVLSSPDSADPSRPGDTSYPRVGLDGELDCGDRQAPHPLTLVTTPSGPACEVPAGTVFMLGDNRDNSHDSRFWGAVSRDAIIGRVTGVWWSRGPTGIRWGRLGRL